MEKMLMKRILIMVPIVMSALFIACNLSNRLANTTWENDDNETIVFGENSFRFYDSPDSVSFSGTYSISGDDIVLDYDLTFWGHQQAHGSLIGDSFAFLRKKEFKRVK
jgi:hypothetical protein